MSKRPMRVNNISHDYFQKLKKVAICIINIYESILKTSCQIFDKVHTSCFLSIKLQNIICLQSNMPLEKNQA
jgi:hypothetical protein